METSYKEWLSQQGRRQVQHLSFITRMKGQAQLWRSVRWSLDRPLLDTPFLRVSAIIMETGGYLSHSSIVAREYGIPAVVNVPGVTTLLKDGQKVVVDGDGGKIYLIK